jgi:hypothetical protein
VLVSKPVKQGDRSTDRDFSGLTVQTLFGYLGAWAPAGSIERVLQLAGETRTVAELTDSCTQAPVTMPQSRRTLRLIVLNASIWHDCPVGDEELEDWYTDPFGRHEARWMSHGVPTSLVRDGRTEGTDPVVDEPFTAKPVRVKYVEHQVGDGSDGFLKSKGGIAVPGGIVTIEPHLSKDGKVPRAKVLLQATTAMGATNVKRDIVVWDEAHEQQLYRDGPYDSITVNRPLERIVAQLNRVGVHEFVGSRGGGDSRTVAVTRETPGQVYEQAALTGIKYYWENLGRIFKRRQ